VSKSLSHPIKILSNKGRKKNQMNHISRAKNILLIPVLIISALIGDCFAIPGLNIHTYRISVFKVIIFLLTIYYLYTFIKDRSKIKKMVSFAKIVILFLFAWALYGTMQLIFYPGIFGAESVRDVIYLYINAAFVFCIINAVSDINKLKYAIFILKISAVVFILFALFEIASGNHLFTSRYSNPNFLKVAGKFDSHIATGASYNENDFAFFLSLISPVFLFGLKGKSKMQVVLHLICEFLLFVVLCINSSFISIMGFIIVVITALIINKIKLFSASSIFAGILAFQKFLSSICRWILENIHYYFYIIFSNTHNKNIKSFIFNQQLQQIDVSPSDILSSQAANTSFSIRFKLFGDGFAMLLKSKLFGVGPDAFRKNVPSIRTDAVNPHDWWMEILSEYGILVFIGYILIYVFVIIKLIKGYIATHMAEAGIMIASMLGFFIACVAPSSLLRIPMQWLMLALAIATIGIMERAVKENMKNDE
jgi:teichuronic acid biosynthesis protein TuaE